MSGRSAEQINAPTTSYRTSSNATWDELWPVAKRCGARIERITSGVIEKEEGQQVAFEWLMKHDKKVEKSRDEETGELNLGFVYHDAMQSLTRWARNEIAKMHKHELRWQQFYTRERVEALVPTLWLGEGTKVSSETGIRAARDPSTGGDLRAMMIDVARAFKECVGKAAEAAMFQRYALGMTWVEIGAGVGITESGARARVNDALDDMVDYLNGLHPVPDDGPGTRTAASNASARVATERGYSEWGSDSVTSQVMS